MSQCEQACNCAFSDFDGASFGAGFERICASAPIRRAVEPWPGPSIGWNLEAINPAQRQRMMRQWTFMNKRVSEKYLTATNDVGYTTRTIAQGGPLYVSHCLKYHGETGLGNGECAGSDPFAGASGLFGPIADRRRPVSLVFGRSSPICALAFRRLKGRSLKPRLARRLRPRPMNPSRSDLQAPCVHSSWCAPWR